jgi:hypothetical protein
VTGATLRAIEDESLHAEANTWQMVPMTRV